MSVTARVALELTAHGLAGTDVVCVEIVRSKDPVAGFPVFVGDTALFDPTTLAHHQTGRGSGSAASPVFGSGNRPLASLSISGWAGRLDLRRVGPAVQTAAPALSRERQVRGPSR